MRRRKAVIFEDSGVAELALRRYFNERSYETVIVSRPAVCPVYDRDQRNSCVGPRVCSDLMVIVEAPANGRGEDLLSAQRQLGCKLTPRNKCLIVPRHSAGRYDAVSSTGAALFRSPVDIPAFGLWVRDCEDRMDLSLPLAVRRIVRRQDCCLDVRYHSWTGETDGVAQAVNLSNCGICLKTAVPLEPHQVVQLWSKQPILAEEALVQWVRKTDDAYFAGLTFCV